MSTYWYFDNCPNCRNGELQQHSKSVWCLRCGWARNRFPDPATGRPAGVPVTGKEASNAN